MLMTSVYLHMDSHQPPCSTLLARGKIVSYKYLGGEVTSNALLQHSPNYPLRLNIKPIRCLHTRYSHIQLAVDHARIRWVRRGPKSNSRFDQKKKSRNGKKH